MISPRKSRGKSSGIAIVAVLISAVIFLGIIVAITGTLSVSSRKSTGDQRVTLEAQYAAESGLSRVAADGQANLLKNVTQLLLLVKTPTTTTNAALRKLALQFCNLDPLATTSTLPCTSAGGTDRADRYQIFTNYLTSDNYKTVLGEAAPFDTEAKRTAYLTGAFASGPRYAGDLGSGAKYSATFGLEALRVDLTGSELLFAFKPRDSVSTGTYNASSGVISSRSVTRSYTDEYQLAMKPPSFAYYLSFTDQQESKSSNPETPNLTEAVYYTRDVLLDGPVHTNGIFYYKDRPWLSDEVKSAGCAVAQTDPNTVSPQGCKTFRTIKTAVQTDGASSDGVAVSVATGYPAFTGYPINAPFDRTKTAPEFVKENATAETKPNQPWKYTGDRNVNVEALPDTTGDQKAYAQGTKKLLDASVTNEIGIYLNTVAPNTTPAPAAGTVLNSPPPRVELMATASELTDAKIEALKSGQTAKYQFIQFKAVEQRNNCPAAPTAITIDPISSLLKTGQSQPFIAKLTGAAGSDKNTYAEAAVAQKFDWNPIKPDATLTWDPVVPPTDGSNTVNFTAKTGYSTAFNLVAKARADSSLTATAVITVGAAAPSVTLSADRGDINYDNAIKRTAGNGVKLTWNGSGVITGYRVEFNRNGAGWETLNNLPATATSLEVFPTDYSKTSDSVKYQYRVVAIGPSESSPSLAVDVNLKVTPLKFNFYGVNISQDQNDIRNPAYNGPGYIGSPVTRTFGWITTGGIPPYKYSGVNAGGAPYNQDAYPPSPNTVIQPTVTDTATTGSVTVNMLKNTTLTDYKINYHMQVTDARGKYFTDYEEAWIKGPVAPTFRFSQPPPVAGEFFNVPYGGTQTLTWTKADGSPTASFTLSNSDLGINNSPQAGSNSVGGAYMTPPLAKNTTFEMVATNTPGQVEKRYVSVIVAPQQPPQIDRFTANPASGSGTFDTTLQWGVRFADKVVIERVTDTVWRGTATTIYDQTGNPVGADPKGLVGHRNTLSATAVYKLTASNQQGSVFRYVRVIVNGVGAGLGSLPEPPNIVKLTALPLTLTYPGGKTTVSWTVTNADKKDVTVTRIDPDKTTSSIGSGLNGSEPDDIVSKVKATDTYTVNYLLRATNDFGTVSQVVSVVVLPPSAPNTNLTVDRDTLSFVSTTATPDNSANLSWNNTVSNTGSGTVRYTLQRSPNGNSSWTDVNGMVNTTTKTFKVNVNQNDTNGELAQYYRVIATDTASTLTSTSDPQKITQKPAEAPVVTVNVSKNAVNFNGETITVSWKVSNPTQASGPLSYAMEYQDDGGLWKSIGSTGSDAAGVNVSSAVPKGIKQRIYRFTATGPKVGTNNLVGTAQQLVVINNPALEINSFTVPTSIAEGGTATLSWVITADDAIGLKYTIKDELGNTVVNNGNKKSDSIPLVINKDTTYTLKVEDSVNKTVPGVDRKITVVLPPAKLIGLTLVRKTSELVGRLATNINDAGWVLKPEWGPGPQPTGFSYVINSSNKLKLDAKAVGNEVRFDVKSEAIGGVGEDFNISISLDVAGASFSITPTPVMRLTPKPIGSSLRPRARLTEATCDATDRVAYTWPVFREYMIDKDGQMQSRSYPSTSSTDWIAPATLPVFTDMKKTFNGVVYIESGMTVSGPSRTDPNLPSTAPPAIAGFMALTIGTNGDVRLPNDLKYEFPVCSKAPFRVAATQAVTPAECKRDPKVTPWSRNALGIYTSSGDVLLTTTLKNMNLQAIVMASSGEIKVPGVDAPSCANDLKSTATVGNIEIQGGLIQKYYGKFGTDIGLPGSCGYGRTMTYDIRMKDSSYAPPGFPTANNTAWTVTLRVKGKALPLTTTDTLPLSNGFSRLK